MDGVLLCESLNPICASFLALLLALIRIISNTNNFLYKQTGKLSCACWQAACPLSQCEALLSTSNQLRADTIG